MVFEMDTTIKANQANSRVKNLGVTNRNRKVTNKKAALKCRWKVVKTFMQQNTKDYCENTTLHGLKYIASEDLYPFERLFFAISFVIVVCGSAFFVAKVYTKWDTTPVIMSINSRATFITEDPFPAVTICNLNQAYKSKALQFSEDSTEYAMIQMLCKRQVNVTIANTITDWNNLRSFITEISQPCSNMLLTCRYGAVNYNCSEVFQPIITDSGLCCTFNMVDSRFVYRRPQRYMNFTYPAGYTPVEWSTEKGYADNLPPKFMPFRGVGPGESLGLSLTLDVESDSYYCSSANSIGFKILLHNSNEVPNMREIGLLLAPGRETKVRILAQKTESDRGLRKINRKARQCLFQDEQHLNIFSMYSQRNCEVECLGAMLRQYCGCISFFMPSLSGNESICSIYEASCVENVRVQSMTSNSSKGCSDDCWLSCFDLTYLPDFFSTPLTHSGFQIVNQDIKNISSVYVESNIAVVNIYYKDNSYRSNIQTELTGMTDFLASIGGLIGLFFGFSFISLAEIVYYAMLRPLRILLLKQKRKLAESGKFKAWRKLNIAQQTIFSKRNSKVSQVFGSALQLIHKPNRQQNACTQDGQMVLEASEKAKPFSSSKIAWQPGQDYTP